MTDQIEANPRVRRQQTIDAMDLEAKADLLIQHAGDWPEESKEAAQIALRAAGKLQEAFSE